MASAAKKRFAIFFIFLICFNKSLMITTSPFQNTNVLRDDRETEEKPNPFKDVIPRTRSRTVIDEHIISTETATVRDGTESPETSYYNDLRKTMGNVFERLFGLPKKNESIDADTRTTTVEPADQSSTNLDGRLATSTAKGEAIESTHYNDVQRTTLSAFERFLRMLEKSENADTVTQTTTVPEPTNQSFVNVDSRLVTTTEESKDLFGPFGNFDVIFERLANKAEGVKSSFHTDKLITSYRLPAPKLKFTQAFMTFFHTKNNSSEIASDSNNVLQLGTENITDCLLAQASLFFPAVDGMMFFDNDNASSNGTCCEFQCKIILFVPQNKVLSIQLKHCSKHKLTITETTHTTLNSTQQKTLATCEHYSFRPYHNVFIRSSPGAEVEFTIKTDFATELSFYTNFTVASNDLEGVFTSKSGGYIQTPGFDGYSMQPLKMNSWMKIDVPSGHRIMVSFLHLNMPDAVYFCVVGGIAMYTEQMSETGKQMSLCSKFRPGPLIFRTKTFYIWYEVRENLMLRTRGFKLLFSFHNDTAVPQRLASGAWNCTVSYWADFRQHFPCNLKTDCEDGRDESDCPYTDQPCGVGRLSINGQCFIYLAPSGFDDLLSWKDAFKECQLRGARLAVLNDPKMLNSVERVMDYREYNTIFIGLRTAATNLPPMYKHCFQHLDGSVAYFLDQWLPTVVVQTAIAQPACLSLASSTLTFETHCERSTYASALCEVQPDSVSKIPQARNGTSVELQPPISSEAKTFPNIHVQCPAGHVTHNFLACDLLSACWARDMATLISCPAPMTPLPPMYECASGGYGVPYTLVCDHRSDCNDNSDEDFCVFPPCVVFEEFQCDNYQCIPEVMQCDDVPDCVDGSDERDCRSKPRYFETRLDVLPPAVIDFDGRGIFTVNDSLITSDASSPCPNTHFQCPANGYCLPVYVLCNGVYDCPNHEDEEDCDSYSCPGFYRCRASHVCVHPEHICDGMRQCPQRDDELFCDSECPQNCVCYGTAFFCTSDLMVHKYPDLRFLDASHSNLDFDDVVNNTMLIHLSLTSCNLSELGETSLVNLRSLDLSDNRLRAISNHDLSHFPNLRVLSLVGNPLTSIITKLTTHQQIFPNLLTLNLGWVYMPQMQMDILAIFPNLIMLNLTGCGIDRLLGEGFQMLNNLRALDLRGCPMTFFPPDMFKGLESLETVFADNYKLCCPAMLPSRFKSANCKAPSSEISSCKALLRSDIYRVFLSVFAFLSLIGNVISFVFRAINKRDKSKFSFDVFVANLCMADFLMGVYLGIIGVADWLYQGTYLWNDVMWRNSIACKTAGFLSLLSNEVSAFMICLITLDRFLVLHFPLSTVRFSRRSAQLTSCFVWAVGLVISMVPLLPWTSHWQFYSQTSICIPLPVTRNDFPGHQYSFSIMIIFNFVLFVLIALGQMFIYWSIQKNSMSVRDTSAKSTKDLTIARRLITVAVSDFLCWFPIGLLGLLAKGGTSISGEVNVAIAVFVLPLNSAVNPYLYTLNIIQESRRKKKGGTP